MYQIRCTGFAVYLGQTNGIYETQGRSQLLLIKLNEGGCRYTPPSWLSTTNDWPGSVIAVAGPAGPGKCLFGPSQRESAECNSTVHFPSLATDGSAASPASKLKIINRLRSAPFLMTVSNRGLSLSVISNSASSPK